MNLGIAFQLVDDALDYGGKAAKLGKNVGDDFREGKITLPVVLSFRRGSESERAFWRRTLEHGDVTDSDLETAIGADDQAPRAGGHDQARPALRRDRQGRAGAVPGLGDEAGAGGGGRVLHRAGSTLDSQSVRSRRDPPVPDAASRSACAPPRRPRAR